MLLDQMKHDVSLDSLYKMYLLRPAGGCGWLGPLCWTQSWSSSSPAWKVLGI